MQPSHSASRQLATCSNKLAISYTSGGTSTTTPTNAYAAGCSFWKHNLGVYDRLSAPLKLNIQMLKAEVLEAIVASRGVCPCASTIRCTELTITY